jgi:hypothetical protein
MISRLSVLEISLPVSIIHAKYKLYIEAGTRDCNNIHLVRFEVFTAVAMKNDFFWDVGPCRSCVN